MAQASSTSVSAKATRAKKMMIKKKNQRPVVFDSSFLITVMQHPTPWREDITQSIGAFTPVLLDSVQRELTRLAESGNRKGRFARLALELVARGDFSREWDAGGRPDDEITSFALREGAGVATLDSDLARRLRASRVPLVVGLRGGRVST